MKQGAFQIQTDKTEGGRYRVDISYKIRYKIRSLRYFSLIKEFEMEYGLCDSFIAFMIFLIRGLVPYDLFLYKD